MPALASGRVRVEWQSRKTLERLCQIVRLNAALHSGREAVAARAIRVLFTSRQVFLAQIKASDVQRLREGPVANAGLDGRNLQQLVRDLF